MTLTGLSGVASALELLEHGADDLLRATLGDQRHVVGEEDHRVELGQLDVELVHDVGDVWFLLAISGLGHERKLGLS